MEAERNLCWGLSPKCRSSSTLHPYIQQAYSLDHRVFSGDVNGARSNNWTILIGDHGKKRTRGTQRHSRSKYSLLLSMLAERTIHEKLAAITDLLVKMMSGNPRFGH